MPELLLFNAGQCRAVGSLVASEADILFTQKLLLAAVTVEMTICDYIIITEEGYVSILDIKEDE